MSDHTAESAFPLAPVAIALGSVALALRPPGTLAGLAVVAAAGVAGVSIPIPIRDGSPPRFPRWVAVTTLGIFAFVAARLLATPISSPVTFAAAAATGLAAVSEEAFFRRLVYGWLAGFGPLLAISAAAVTFAVVHVPAYGWSVLPLNLAAGILLGWQRWASGGWSSPALTHLAANLIQIMT